MSLGEKYITSANFQKLAYNLARSCGLIPSGSDLFVVEVEDDVQEAYSRILPQDKPNYCLVVSTTALALLDARHPHFLYIIQK